MLNRSGVNPPAQPATDPCAQCPIAHRVAFLVARLSSLEAALHRSPQASTRRGSPPPSIGQQGLVDAVLDDRPSHQKDHQQ